MSAEVVDYCPSCAATEIGLSPIGFEVFAPESQGVVYNVTWVIN